MREYREVRLRLGDDPDGASPYIGFARTLLGQLKNEMTFAGLLQGVRRKRFNNGVWVEVSSIFGQDTIRITVPPRPESQEQAGVTYVIVEQLCAAGGSWDSDYGGMAFAIRWMPEKGIEQLEPLGGAFTHAFAVAVGPNCTVFGYSFGHYTLPLNQQWRACYWDADKVVHDLGVYGIVVDVSDDGKKVLFWNYDAASGSDKSAYILDRDTGVVTLIPPPATGWVQMQGYAISGNGKKAIGDSLTSGIAGFPLRSSWVWEEGVGTKDIGHAAAVNSGSTTTAYDISADGTTIVGITYGAQTIGFVLVDGVFNPLPDLAPEDIPADSKAARVFFVPRAVSAHGVVVVGSLQFSGDGLDTRYYGFRSQAGVTRLLPKDNDNKQRITALSVTNDGSHAGTAYTQTGSTLYDSPLVYRGHDKIIYREGTTWIFPEIQAINRHRIKIYSDGWVEDLSDDESTAFTDGLNHGN